MGEKAKAPYKNYEENNRKILDAYKALADEKNITPSFPEVVAKTKELNGKGVSLNTIKRHFRSLDFKFTCERERIYIPDVVEAIRKSATGKTGFDGKSRAQKLYLQVMEGYIEKREQKTDIVGELNVNADISGELKVNIQRSVINSREDLQALRDAAAIVKPAEVESAPSSPAADAVRAALDKVKQNIPVVAQNVETMIFFKD